MSYAVSASELLSLYEVFQTLDIQSQVTATQNFLSHQELFSLPEFRHHPLRRRLKYALQVKNDDFIRSASRAVEQPQRRGRSRAKPVPSSPEESVDYLDVTEDDFFTEVDRLPYIDFELFCQYLTPFCQRTPIDVKVTFLFRLFDLDEDGAIDENDLTEAIKLSVGRGMTAAEIQETVKVIFAEIGQEKIDKDDFQRVLWVTDFDQKLTIQWISQ